MKKITPLFLALTIAFASCTSEEKTAFKEENLLKSYKIEKDVQGRYSVDYNVNSNVTTEFVKNSTTKENEIYLFTGKNANGKNFTEALLLENNKLKVGFVENNEKRKSLIIEDENIVLAKGQENYEFLNSYSIEDLEDSQYKLKFEVKEGVNVTFEYNEAEDIYEVHLKEGTSNGVEFSKTYNKLPNTPLKIDFVNHINSGAARGVQESQVRPRRPRMIVVG